jgi:acyl-coenzyme A synthetase/AMP-(fatty) acid ligase
VAFGREGQRSAAELRRDVATLAARLAPAKGSRLALHCHDAYAFAVGLLAAGQVGAVAVLAPSRQPGALLRLAADVAGFVLDGADAPARLEGRPCWSPLAGSGPEAPLVALDREAVWVELFTSGTTGEEKPVPKAVRHLEDEVAVLGARFGAALGPGARMLSTASPQHLYGLLFRVLWPLATGRPFLRTPLLHPEELGPYMDEADFALASTPVALRRLADHAELASRAQRCRAVFSSGGPLDAEVARGVADALGAPPFEIYGSTETGGVAVRQQWTGDEVWEPLPGVAAEVDPDDGRLVVVSPFVSCGEPVGGGRTRLPTGDRAEAAPGGGFRLRGRVDRVVKIAEKRLSLPDMESRLREHPAVGDAGVAGEPDPRFGRRVAAWVVLRADARATAPELDAFCRARIAGYKIPRAFHFVAELPRGPSGKLLRRELEGVERR